MSRMVKDQQALLALCCLIKAMNIALNIPFTSTDAESYRQFMYHYTLYAAQFTTDYMVRIPNSANCTPNTSM